MVNEPHDTANRVAGEILRISVNLENDIERFLMYCILDFNVKRQNFFRDEIIQSFDFEKKRVLFEKICKIEKYDKKQFEKIRSDIRHIQKIRNKVAHWESNFEGNPENPDECLIRLWSKKSLKFKEHSIVLN